MAGVHPPRKLQHIAVALLLGALTAVVHGQEYDVVEGELSVLTQHVPPGVDGDSFFLELPTSNGSTQVAQLAFKSKPQDLVTGDKLAVRVRSSNTTMRGLARRPLAVDDLVLDLLEVDSFNVTAPNPNKDFSYNGGSITISSITWLTRICGKASVTDVEAFKRKWLNAFNPNAGTEFGTLQNHYKECSWGKARFEAGENIVVDLTDVDLGCSGTWQGLPWSADRCGTPEMFGWMDAVKKYSLNVLKIDYTKFSRWVVVIPENRCPWSGVASIGCGRNCGTWFKGAYALTELYTPFHELGHNLGLQHATSPGVEYGDGSSNMGGCCGDRCFNAPNSWQVAWAQPIAVLNATSFPEGVWRTFDIPPLTLNAVNHVQLVPTWASGSATPAYFFSYRQRIGWDRTIVKLYTEGLSVHIFNGSQSVSPQKSELQGIMPPGSSMKNSKLRFVLKVNSADSKAAQITLCRFTETTETSCSNERDDDCNGLIDAAEPQCRASAPEQRQCNRNGVCEAGETYENCRRDCKPVCGDGKCQGSEDAAKCPKDCPVVCGDCHCDTKRGESAITCPKDCPPECGDGFCDYARGESAATCPDSGKRRKGDCPAKCGDGYCDSKRGESVSVCPQDCQPVCGDRLCSPGENSRQCRKDCPLRCGDRYCDTSALEQLTCRRDCPARRAPPPPPPPPMVRAPSFRCVKSPPPSAAASPSGRRMLGVADVELSRDDRERRLLQAALADMQARPNTCGDGICRELETAATCPADCPARCGDGHCDKHRGEKPLTCRADCPAEWCGDGVCGVSETTGSCAVDCCPKPTCGDGVCQTYGGENCLTCPQDCAGSEQEGFCCGAFLSCATAACSSNGRQCTHECDANSGAAPLADML